MFEVGSTLTGNHAKETEDIHVNGLSGIVQCTAKKKEKKQKKKKDICARSHVVDAITLLLSPTDHPA